jgi:ATP-binding cassette subfamily F protein 3
MLTLSQCSIHFGGNYLFEDITFTIGTRDRIGLVGRNGAGKSTMLRILSGQISPETGNLIKSSDYTIGYLAQDLKASLGKTVLEEAMTAFKELHHVESELDRLNMIISERTDYESEEYSDLLIRHAALTERYVFLGGNLAEGLAQRILMGLGFTEDDMFRLVDEFSGGWQMRVELAKILLRKPDCLLLDEPTNHLDIESVQWLEQFLRTYEGALVLISHDRAFLDAVTNRTIEITRGIIEDYSCSYSAYVKEREERRELNKQAWQNQQKEIARTEEFIERFRSKANLASRVQSRVKMLEKLDRIELEEDDKASIHFKFPPAPRSGAIVAEAKSLHKYYGDNHVLKGLDFTLERGQKIAFVGKNGEGKTTFARLIAGVDSWQKGELTIGHNVKIGYYAQQQAEALDGDRTIFETIDEVATGEMRTRIRSLLGAFLFSGDDVYKKVKVLSGGEKSRLAMAKLLLEPSNLLILDEPTNHLDMRSKDVLKKAVQAYDGALIVVSHDRDFLAGLTTSVAEFRNGNLRFYPGDIYDFLRERNIEQLRQLEMKTVAKPVVDTSSITQADREDRKKKDKEKKRIEKLISDAEIRIQTLEEEQTALEEEMNHPDFYADTQASGLKVKQYESVKQTLATAYEEWTRLQEELSN